MTDYNISLLADEIIDGRRLEKNDDLQFLLDCDLEELGKGADRLRQHINGDRVDLCTIIDVKSGRCS